MIRLFDSGVSSRRAGDTTSNSMMIYCGLLANSSSPRDSQSGAIVLAHRELFSPLPPPYLPTLALTTRIPSTTTMQSLDQPLDAIIQSKRKQRQPNRRQRGSRPQSAKQAAGVAQPEPAVAPAQAVAAQVHVGDKIIVSNLPEDVNEQQIKVSALPFSVTSPLHPHSHVIETNRTIVRV